VGGLARFEGDPVVAIGHQKGRDTRENIARNFGMPHPEGYRKALRLMELGAKFRKPIITFIDTPGAYPGLGAEERAVAEAIARNLREIPGWHAHRLRRRARRRGGALAMAWRIASDARKHAIYSVIPPRAARPSPGRGPRRPRGGGAMRITAPDLAQARRHRGHRTRADGRRPPELGGDG
jgi:acetyl-CoA carboxylase carboxyl transferase subunit alpha